MTFKLSRLTAVLRGRTAEEPKGTARAGASATRIVELEQTIAELQTRLERMSNRLEKSKAKTRDIDERLRARTRNTPSPDILRQVLIVRARQMPISSFDRAAAAARDRRLRGVSPEYRSAFDAAEDPMIEKVTIDGLDWWVPLDPRVEDRVERARRQGFPLRAILQTREVGLGGVMLDLGANLGRTSIPRVLLGDVRAVYAAEPFPTNYAALARNIREYNLHGFVLPDQVAVGAERGVVDLRVSRYPGGHRVLHQHRRPVETISVQTWPVDEWIARVGVEPEAISFVKVDTQGSEVRVLQGAASLLTRAHIAWQIEVDPTLLKRAGTPLRDLCALIETRFTHFLDLGGHTRGPRSRPIGLVREALTYLGRGREKTDLILYHARS